jgi:putative membrane protein
MGFLITLILGIASNIAAFLFTEHYITGFHVTHDPLPLIMAAIIFGFLNTIIKPLLKFALGPLILLTLGLGFIIINALILYLLTLFTQAVTIDSTVSLFYAALLIGAANLVITLFRKLIIRK